MPRKKKTVTKIKEVEKNLIFAQCPVCEVGVLSYTSMVKTDNNDKSQYLHACSSCIATMWLDNKYPYEKS